MAIINLKFDDLATKSLDNIAKNQIPFLVAKTLTNTAQKAQEEVRSHVRESFFIRKKSGGFESSIRIKPANKKNLTSEVYTMAAFAALQQTGGVKKAKNGRLAIPNYQAISEVKRRSAKNSPSIYLAGDAFKMRTKSGQEVIAKRDGKNLKILYFLKKRADVNKKLDMIETTIATTKKELPKILQSNFSKVLK